MTEAADQIFLALKEAREFIVCDLCHEDRGVRAYAARVIEQLDIAMQHITPTVLGCESCEYTGRIEVAPDSTETHPCDFCQPENFAAWKAAQPKGAAS